VPNAPRVGRRASAESIRRSRVRRRGFARRRLLRYSHVLEHALTPWLGRGMSPPVLKRLREFPSLPAVFRRRYRAPRGAWAPFDPVRVPAELQTVAGIRRDPQAEQAAFVAAPLRSFFHIHADTMAWVAPRLWRAWLPVAPRLLKARRAVRLSRRQEPSPGVPAASPAELVTRLKQQAAVLGISAIGVAKYDPKYTFAEYAGKHPGDRVVVCVLEQNYATTQLLPTSASEQAALSTYAELMDSMAGLCGWLNRQGFRAQGDDQEGESIFIHYGVAAGLGQLGLNGQLLTPQAGSRCRLGVIYTDAPLDLDSPVDYGIEGVCDRCQACVRRCPVGAIPSTRREHRGVTKIKLNTKRCFPVVAQAAGCAVCMKVCPVQAYGLGAVIDCFDRTGTILGQHTDDLEGYDWFFDGRHYPPGQTPRVPAAILSPPDMPFSRQQATPGDAAGR
jgi:epoxyqueuosine reductase